MEPIMTDAELTGKVVLLTGAAGGIGQALARGFAAVGLRVGLLDVHRDAVEALANEIGADQAIGLAVDITDPQAAATAVQQVRTHFGALDFLVNNAGLGMSVVRADHFTRVVQIEDITPETFLRFMKVNMCGGFFMARAAVPIFRAQSCGRIINVTTSLSTMIRPGFSPYGPAKAAFEAWTAGLAGELAGTGITVNVVTPGGATDTPMVPAESGFRRTDLIRPEWMVPPMLYLFSATAAHVTGRRFIAALWDAALPAAEAARRAGAPVAWTDLATRAIEPGKGSAEKARPGQTTRTHATTSPASAGAQGGRPA
jgi:NAD(P)-dependent dehydrogenase (short-subunit alcohol dehydrogenase family)